MDTSDSFSEKPSLASSVMAPPTTAPSISIALHPLVIINISEHWTRVRAQTGKSSKVYGALLGRQKGRTIELCTSFEMKMDPNPNDDSLEDIDLEFLNTNISQFKQVFSDFDFLGWYTTGGELTERDIVLHKQICTINESPVLLKLDPFGKHTDLPVSVYESVIDIIDGDVKMLFIELEFTLATEEAERIGVDHICQHSHSNTMVQSAVADHLNAQYSAITLLNNRIRVIYEYVKAIKENKNVKKNNEILREIQSLCHRLPVMNSPNFYKEFYTLYNDVTWISYLAVIMQGSNTLNQYLNKFLVMYDKTITKRGRSILI
ncbi:unnamed protein product [Brachionus calyciflorus]|uniref:COP9 signalosome complex subunit 6 n=1 Tax=Brachionus calyciflorus TaxID=104777 RepID=A0A813RLE4_9BILA|nr:unnamed protein product [Brachionus calyciflorus]